MDSESLIKTSTSVLSRGMFAMIIIFFFVVSPTQIIQEEIKLVLKGPRPYISKDSNTIPQNTHSRIKPGNGEQIFHPFIFAAANRYSVDPALVKAIIMAESNYNPRAISKKGAVGLMQLMPTTAAALGVKDSLNPEHNINGGVKYLKKLLNQFEGDLELAVAAYNAGSKKVKKYNGVPPYKATRYYVKKVFDYYQYYKKEMEQTNSQI